MAKEVTPEQIAQIDEMVARAHTALDIIATYDQQRVDRLCQAVAAAVCDMKVWAPICDEAVDETSLGDKVTKRNKRNKIKLILRDCLRQPSVGIIEENPAKGLVKYAKPAGVIASLVPTTNPCLTPAGQIVYAIKARDVMICSPHPRAKVVTNKIIDIIRATLVREGAPADIIQGIKDPSINLTKVLMERCDLVIATGGRPMVKSAYSSGTPAYGSGAGNATVIIDDTCNTPERQKEAAENTRISKTSDFGSGCSCDGNLVIHESIYDDFVKALVAEGAYLANEEEAEKTAGTFASLFGFEKKSGNSSVFAGSAVEAMKSPYLGAKGHIAVGTNSVDRAVNYLESQGVEFNMDSAKYKDGKLTAIYLKKEVAGFAVHLVQK